METAVWVLGFRVWGVYEGCRVQGLRLRITWGYAKGLQKDCKGICPGCVRAI